MQIRLQRSETIFLVFTAIENNKAGWHDYYRVSAKKCWFFLTLLLLQRINACLQYNILWQQMKREIFAIVIHEFGKGTKMVNAAKSIWDVFEKFPMFLQHSPFLFPFQTHHYIIIIRRNSVF